MLANKYEVNSLDMARKMLSQKVEQEDIVSHNVMHPISRAAVTSNHVVPSDAAAASTNTPSAEQRIEEVPSSSYFERVSNILAPCNVNLVR